MANLITASTYLFAMKLCKPITLWCLVLRLFRNLPDEEFHAFEAEVRNLTGMAALAILEDIPNSRQHQYTRLRAFLARATTVWAGRVPNVVDASIFGALHVEVWEEYQRPV